MSQSRYYGHTRGAVVRYSTTGSGRVLSFEIGVVRRHSKAEQSKGAGLLTFTPQRKIWDIERAKHLSMLALDYHRGELSADDYMTTVDAVLAGCGQPLNTELPG